jgi:hypothetical protein
MSVLLTAGSTGCGSFAECDTLERESNTVSYTDAKGKTTILCSEGSERQAKVMTVKDGKGMAHSYCKESETKSKRACCDRDKGGKGGKVCYETSTTVPGGTSKAKGGEKTLKGLGDEGNSHGGVTCFKTKLDITPL